MDIISIPGYIIPSAVSSIVEMRLTLDRIKVYKFTLNDKVSLHYIFLSFCHYYEAEYSLYGGDDAELFKTDGPQHCAGYLKRYFLLAL